MDVFFIIRNLFLFSLAVIFFLIICLCYFLFNKTAQLDKQVSSLRDIIQQMIQEIRTQQIINARPNYAPPVYGGAGPFAPASPDEDDLKEIDLDNVPEAIDFTDDADADEDEDDDADEEEDEADDDDDEAGFVDGEVQDIQDMLSVQDDDDADAAAPAADLEETNLDEFEPEAELAMSEDQVKHLEINLEPAADPPAEGSVVVSKLPAEAPQPPATHEKPSFRHLNIHQLKQIVISKGLATNTNKMKKDELLNLLDPATTLD